MGGSRSNGPVITMITLATPLETPQLSFLQARVKELATNGVKTSPPHYGPNGQWSGHSGTQLFMVKTKSPAESDRNKRTSGDSVSYTLNGT